MEINYMWHATERDLVAIDKGRGFEIWTLEFDKDRPDHAQARPLRYDCIIYWDVKTLFRFGFVEGKFDK